VSLAVQIAEERRKHLRRERQLLDALTEAVELIQDWASYASPYFQEKHDLAGDIARLQAILGSDRPTDK
jgi:hypothetical protein